MEVYGSILEVKRYAVHDGDGIRTTLFLKGCPLMCRWCHNPEGIAEKAELAYFAHKCISCGECAVCKHRAHIFTENGHIFLRENCTGCGECEKACLGDALKLYGKRISAQEAANLLCDDRVFFEASGGGVTLSGGEPLMQSQFCAEVFRILKEKGINTALDTCGYAPRSALEEVLPYTDKVLFDIKAAREETHICYTGKSNALILENLKVIDETGVPIEIRIPLISGVNDGEMEEIAQLLSACKNITAVRLLPYHGYTEAKYEALGRTYAGKNFTAPDAAMLKAAANTLQSAGLTVILP